MPAAPRRGGGQRRPAGSAAELLSQLQPTTKALAQMLAGNTKASGQLVHARNILDQAQRMIDERQIDRMQPAMREEFLEQVARLRLTVSDADDLEEEAVAADLATIEAVEDEDSRPQSPPPISMDRLRELALSLAEPATPATPPETASARERLEALHDDDEPEGPDDHWGRARASSRSSSPSEDVVEETKPVVERTGKTREKLRLKTVTYLPGD
ncbi:MAG: hypothetical protein H6851_12840 [Geminicoccaceae bacterium]|nr:hypothetical protein [Geminicoccaceae bacterium]MCB9944491.1 hypothetical protein [Geminicoccaceae bacterium]